VTTGGLAAWSEALDDALWATQAAASPGGWSKSGDRPRGLVPRSDRVPWWVRVCYHTPFLERRASTWMWSHGGFDVLPRSVRPPPPPEPPPASAASVVLPLSGERVFLGEMRWGMRSRVWFARSEGPAPPGTAGGSSNSGGPRTCTGCDRRQNRCRCGSVGRADGDSFAAPERLRWRTAQRGCGRRRHWVAGISPRFRTRPKFTAPVFPRADFGSLGFPVQGLGRGRGAPSSDQEAVSARQRSDPGTHRS
jgi:hypothetical protein